MIQRPPPMMNKASRNLIAPPLLIVVAGLAIIAAHTLLNSRIDAQQRQAAAMIYFDTLQLPSRADIQLDAILTTDDTSQLGLRTPQAIYVARQHHRVIGIVLPLTAREGYAGDIDLLLGIDTNGAVISAQVLAHRETRDLGDKIEPDKSHWLEQFHGATFEEAQKNLWQLRSEGGDFDGITGATVTSRAVVKAVQQGLAYFFAHREELLGNSGNE